jgi:hypothetical protein
MPSNFGGVSAVAEYGHTGELSSFLLGTFGYHEWPGTQAGGSTYAAVMLDLFPRGLAWTRSYESASVSVVGSAAVLGPAVRPAPPRAAVFVAGGGGYQSVLAALLPRGRAWGN